MITRSDIYTLAPTKIKFNIGERFPKLSQGSNIAVAVSGGLESTLIAKICLELYGNDRVILLYSDNMFSGSSDELNKNITHNVLNVENILGVKPTYLEIDHNLHSVDKVKSYKKINSEISKTYNVEFVMWGFTKLFFDVAEFKEPEVTDNDVIRTCFSNPEKYYSVIEGFHLDTGLFTKYVRELDIPLDVYKLLEYDKQNNNIVVRPFDVLDKPEVIDLYRQLGLMDLAYKTSSCILSTVRNLNQHCGTCFNCQQRYDAFATLGIKDNTKYASDNVEVARQQMEYAMKERQGLK